jgi:cytochrome d ubiquinol oxidase subunit I
MLFVAFIAVIFAIISGLLSIPMLYSLQPEKYAALELDIHPISNAPEIIFGTYANGSLSGYLTIIPNLQSILATGSPNGTVPGLSQFPTNTWPPLIVHDFFDFMVLFGFGLGIFFILLIFLKILKVDILINKIVLILSIIAGVVSILLLEIGWLMAEFGRQPWIIYNIMTVSQAANYSSSIMPIAIAIILFYVFIIPATIYIIRKTYKNRDLSKELGE